MDNEQLAKELSQIRSRIGITEGNTPNGNGLLNKIDQLEQHLKSIDKKLEGVVTLGWLKSRIITLGSLAAAITACVVFFERYIQS